MDGFALIRVPTIEPYQQLIIFWFSVFVIAMVALIVGWRKVYFY